MAAMDAEATIGTFIAEGGFIRFDINMTIQIPGMKVLDEIILGLPTNSAQRLEIEKLRIHITKIEAENCELKLEIDAITHRSSLKVETAKILQFMFQREFVTVEEVSQKFGYTVGDTKFHLDQLKKRGLRSVSKLRPAESQRYSISAAGREYIVEHGMNS